MGDDEAAIIGRWFDFLNRVLEADEVFTEDVVIEYLPLGKGGHSERLEGRAAVTTWGRRGAAGRFVFSAVGEACHVAAVETLPPGDGPALRVGYRVDATFLDFSNTGDDTLHVRAGRICAVLHEPEPLAGPDEPEAPSEAR